MPEFFFRPTVGETEAQRRIEACLRESRTSLSLFGLGLTTLPPEIGQLAALMTLDLADNQLADLPPDICKLKALTELGLTRNQFTALPPEIGELSALARLDVASNALTALPPEIGRLSALKRLLLAANELTTLPPEMGRLTELKSLDCNSNHLSTLPPEIGNLTALTTLRLFNNQITTLPTELARLTSLTTLDLAGNRLTSLAAVIGRLAALTILRLDGNQLDQFPVELTRLTALTLLNVGGNRLTTLPPEIGRLTALTSLVLAGNQLMALPPEIGQLSALTTLDLRNNRLKELPREIGQLKALAELYLHDNPTLGLPEEVLGPTWAEVTQEDIQPKPPKEILDYYFRIRPLATATIQKARAGQRVEPAGQLLREARVIVIGDGGAGKTSLVRALLHGEAARASEETTRDVVVEDWPDLELIQPGTRKKQPVSVHLWDFGGQEPMHAAHPYFFTNRTLYLVVATAREVGVEERIAYWLKMITAHGQGARALVAVNKIDQHPMDITRRELCTAFPGSLPADPVEAFFATSCRGRMKGIASLRKALVRELQAMEQIWTYVPTEWMTAKKLVEERRTKHEDTLTFDEWEQLCDIAKVASSERNRALQLLRDLGTVVSFPEDDQLSSLGVLNPSWVTGGIYPLLTSKDLAEAGGLLERKEIGKLLKDARSYPRHRHGWLIELMKKFELLFENDGQLLMPARLPKDSPPWALDGFWKSPDTLHLELRYHVLPESVISKFITRWHDQAWNPGSWWRHGIAVKDENGQCEALVRAHLGDPGRIDLKVQGPKIPRQAFVAELRAEFRRLAKNLDGELWLVLGGVHPEKYDDLLVLVHEGKERTIKRVVAGKMIEFNLSHELGLIEPEDQQQQAVDLLHQASADFSGHGFRREPADESADRF